MGYAPENRKKVNLDYHVDCEIYRTISVMDWGVGSTGIDCDGTYKYTP